ncbi:glycosyltransferase 87 family protein [Nonlabens ponticola]|uniref:DUF2029 domain-containing protein n=1 Tax=Nonlabens ponticola TaxID=2496866 RepID=A0A3S9MWR5_9FLAO|nr:glycosyltransferase 87 family protein [Nonlabens ponticola]AZQ43582.1 DUF2029 domain-containing protein [Nonlabens ponticola]
MKARLQNGFGILLILSFLGYSFLSTLSRKQYYPSLLTYIGLFALFLALCWMAKTATEKRWELFSAWLGNFFKAKSSFVAWLLAGVVLRLVLLWVTPWLSQDFFRFIWDGHLSLNGFNPYLYLPDDLIVSGADFIPNAEFLHASMGSLSSGHFTNYPPLNQFFFAAAAYLGGDSLLHTVIWMRVFIILADVVTFIYGIKLLRLLGKPDWLILLYYLNPFVIVELTGNLHWEGVMACFMLIGVYHFICYDKWRSGLFLGFGVLVKLLPVLVFPLVVRARKFKWIVLFYITAAVTIIAGFAPLVSGELIEKYAASIGLWFGTFEFNASIYYVIRAIGYEVTGYNIIGTVGKILPLITIAVIILLSLLRQNKYPEVLLTSILLAFTTYLLLSTTVHPWYLTIPLLFSLFTRYRFMVVWSCLVFVSYSAYANADYSENFWWIGLEYGVVLFICILELTGKSIFSARTNQLNR